MTSACMVWVELLLQREPRIQGPVLEVGSRDVNGSVRSLFADTTRFPTYLGVDIEAGPGVDQVAKGDALPFPARSFGVVVCTETMEHDDRFWVTLRECRRVLNPEGAVIVTTRGIKFPRHDYPSDYWRFTAAGLRTALESAGFEQVDAVEDADDFGVFAVAFCSPVAPAPSPAPMRRSPLLTKEEIDALCLRIGRFAEAGMTSIADAFYRVASDRQLLLSTAERCYAHLSEAQAHPGLLYDLRVATGREVPVPVRRTCRGCGVERLEPILSLGTQSLTCFPRPDEIVRYGSLNLMFCRNCGLAQLAHSTPADWLYTWYGYRSGTNPMMVAALRDVAEAVTHIASLQSDDVVIDIGSNDGTFLRQLSPGVRKVGFDPVKNFGMDVAGTGLDLWVNDYFNPAGVAGFLAQHGKAKAVTALAMFYDLEDPAQFVRQVRQVLRDDGVFVVQQNYALSMLQQNGYDNICHEHVTYFALKTLIPVLARGGFRVIDVSVNDVNGGSFRTYCVPTESARVVPGGPERIQAMVQQEEVYGIDCLETYRAFAARVKRVRDETTLRVAALASAGKRVYVYGASTRGLVIMEYCGLRAPAIYGAAERNPDKYGRLYAGTGIPCVPEEEARQKADCFLVLPHHFLPEFMKREAAFLERGGKFLVPLPEFHVVGRDGVEP